MKPAVHKGTKGSVIVADFNVKMFDTDKMDAAAKLFDLAGNLVAEIESIGEAANFTAELYDKESTQIRFYWNGRNKNGRFVSTGSYIVKLQIKLFEDGTIKNIDRQLIIGVKTRE